MEKKDIDALEIQIKKLQEKLAELSDGKDLEELFRLIHWPGWTTPIDLAFVTGTLTHLTGQVETMIYLKNTLMGISRVIGTDKVFEPQPSPW